MFIECQEQTLETPTKVPNNNVFGMGFCEAIFSYLIQYIPFSPVTM